MTKPGIKIISEELGHGAELKAGDIVRLKFDVQLNRGDVLSKDQEVEITIGDRGAVAGFRYGIEGMRVGGRRKFKASPHLCYGDRELTSIPKNAVLIFDIKDVRLLKSPLSQQ